MKNRSDLKWLIKCMTISLAIAGIGYAGGSKCSVKPVQLEIVRGVVEGDLEKKLLIKQSKGLIVLDPGHGYDNRTNGMMDYGASLGSYKESEIVLNQAKRIQKLLENRGYEVILTRNDDKQSVPLRGRLSVAKESDADLLVSLHCNAHNSPSANGIETFYEGESSRKLAKVINDGLFNSVKLRYSQVQNRGIKQRNLAVLDENFPSVLVESGFITNDRDRGYLIDNIPDVEQGIADAIYKYMNSRSD